MENAALTEPRQKLLDATDRLVYSGGICATGMDLIVKTSGVARKTVYRYFATKNELVAEALKKRDERWLLWFTETSRRADSPGGKLLATFDALEQWFHAPDFRGCAFINAAGEVGDESDPIRAVARRHKLKLRDFLRQLAQEYGADDADQLASEFLILIDGAITVASITGDKNAARKARGLARKLLNL